MSDLRDYGGSFGGGGGGYTNPTEFSFTLENTSGRGWSINRASPNELNNDLVMFNGQDLKVTIKPINTYDKSYSKNNLLRYKISRIVFKIGGQTFRDIYFRGGDIWNVRYNYFCLGSVPAVVFNGGVICPSVTFNLNETGQFWNHNGNPFASVASNTKNDVSFLTNGYKTITATVYYTKQRGYEGGYYEDEVSISTYGTYEETYVIGSVLFYNFKLQDSLELDTSSVKKTFYKNESFNSTGLTATASYNYATELGGGFAFKETAQNPTVTPPTITTTKASESKTVTVSFGYATGSYSITIYGYKSITFPDVKSIRNTTAFRLGESPNSTQDNTAIVYGDNVSENVATTFTIDTSKAGNYNSSASAHATKTNEDVYDSKSYTVYALTSIAVTSTTHKTSYKFNEDWSTNNLVVTAHYGNNDEAGTQSVASNSTITFPASKSVGKHSVNVSYTEQGVTKTTSYNVFVNGILDTESNPIEITLPNNGRVAKGNSLDTSAIVIKGYTYTDGTISDKDTLTFTGTGNSITFSDQDNGSTGTKTLTITMVKDGQTIVKTVNYVVYTHSEFRVNNFDDFTFYVEDAESIPTFSLANYGLSNIEVQGKDSDNDTWHTMTSNYSLSIANGATMSIGKNVLTITDGISGKSVSKTITIAVGEPVSIDSYNGSIADYHERGETIDLSGITIMVTLQGGIEHEVKSGFSGYLKYGTNSEKNSLKFDDNDTVGTEYTLVITYAGLEIETTLKTTLNGISSISDVSSTQATYEVGQKPQASKIKYKVNFVHGESQEETGDTYITDFRNTAFAYSEGGDNNSAGSVTLSFKVHGFSVSCDVNVKKAIALQFVTDSNTKLNYEIMDSLAIDTFGIKKIFNNGTYEMLEDFDDIEWGFTDGTNDIVACTAEKLVPNSARTTKQVRAYAFLMVYTEYQISTATPLSLNVLALRKVEIGEQSGDTFTAISSFTLNEQEQLGDYLIGKKLRAQLNDGDYLPIVTINTTNVGTAVGNLFLDSKACNLDQRVSGNTSLSGYITYTKVTQNEYSGDMVQANFTVDIIYAYGISTNIEELVDDTDTFYVGETLDLSELEVYVVMKNSGNNEYEEEIEVEDYVITLNGFSQTKSIRLSDAGNSVPLKIQYGNFTKTLNLTVEEVVLQSISLTIDPLTFKELDSYVEGDEFSFAGITIVRHYSNGSTDTDLSILSSNVEVKDEDNNDLKNLGSDGMKNATHDGNKVYVFYGELSAQLYKTSSAETIEVAAKELQSIVVCDGNNGTQAISTHKTSFTYGDKFSIAGLVFQANYNGNRNTSEILRSDATGLSVSGETIDREFNPSDDSTLNTTKTITLTYTSNGVSKTTTYDITLAEPTMVSVKTNANSGVVRLAYQTGDTVSFSTLVVTGVYENGWEHVISSGISTSIKLKGTNTSMALDGNNVVSGTNYGIYVVTLSVPNPYKNDNALTTSFEVSYESSGAIVSAVWVIEDNAYEYFVGDEFDGHGVKIKTRSVDAGAEDFDGESTVFDTSILKGTVFRKAGVYPITFTYKKGTFVETKTLEIKVRVSSLPNTTDTKNYKIAIGNASGVLFTEMQHEEATIKLGSYENGTFYPVFPENKVSVDNNSAHTDTYGFNIYTGDDMENDCIGYMDMGLTESDGTVVRKAHLIIFDDPINPIDGDGNIEVKFPHYVAGYADRINKCRFGVVFNNRLFVSGNPEYKNCDWHSGEVNVSQIQEYNNKAIKDYTYFSDLDYCYYGDSDTAIVGYDIYRDGDLIVVKEGSKHQATLYRRQMKLTTATSADGNSVGEGLGEQSFPMYDINSNGGVGGLSHRSIVNFVGETIVLTKNGLKAITSKEDIYNNAKYTYDVSSFINDKIKDEDLTNAVLYIYKETLLLRTQRGLYVGYYGLRNEDNEYEWYFLSNIKADLFFESDGELYFGNDDGEIYRFPLDSKEYTDKERKFVGLGGVGLTVSTSNDSLVYTGEDYADEIKEGREFHIITTFTQVGFEDRSSLMYASLGYFIHEEYRRNVNSLLAYSGVITTRNTLRIEKYKSDKSVDVSGTLDIQELYYDGREVYFDDYFGIINPTEEGSRYFLKKVAENEYQVVRFAGEVLNLQTVYTIRMSFLVNDLAITRITDVSDYNTSGAKQFKLIGDHDKVLDLIQYGSSAPTAYKGVITKEENVSAYFITAPYSMSSITLTKTIWQWIIANDTALASYMDVGYLSSRKQGDYEMVVKSTQGTRQFAYEGLNFEKIQFTSDKLPHVYSRNRTVANVNFIRFIFKNDKDSNMVLTTLNVVYTIAEFTKGVK